LIPARCFLLAQLERIDAARLSADDTLNRSLLVRSLKTSLEAARFKDWKMSATQIWGPHLEYAGLAKDMPLLTEPIIRTI